MKKPFWVSNIFLDIGMSTNEQLFPAGTLLCLPEEGPGNTSLFFKPKDLTELGVRGQAERE